MLHGLGRSTVTLFPIKLSFDVGTLNTQHAESFGLLSHLYIDAYNVIVFADSGQSRVRAATVLQPAGPDPGGRGLGGIGVSGTQCDPLSGAPSEHLLPATFARQAPGEGAQ